MVLSEIWLWSQVFRGREEREGRGETRGNKFSVQGRQSAEAQGFGLLVKCGSRVDEEVKQCVRIEV